MFQTFGDAYVSKYNNFFLDYEIILAMDMMFSFHQQI